MRADTVTAAFARAASAHPERTFLTFGSERISYGEMDARTDRVAAYLVAANVQPGDRVAMMLDNSIDAVIAILAILKTSAVVVPINTALKLEFLRRPVTNSEAKVFIVDEQYLDRFESIAESLPSDALILLKLGEEDASEGISTAIPTRNWAEALKSEGARPEREIAPSDLAMLLYTSGTTGPSKGCMMSHNYLCNLANQAKNSFCLTEADTIWTPLPLFHQNAFTQMLASATSGCTFALGQHFSLSRFWADIEASGATVISILGSIVPLVASREDSEAAKRCFGQLRMVSGAPFPETLRRIWKKRFGVGWAGPVGYGMTEAALITSIDGPEDLPEAASGHANEDFQVRIVDDHDADVPTGTPGELICRPRRAHIMFEGYWKMPEATKAVMRDGWFHTGDVGKFDADGNFYFLGRKKEYLRRRGENVSLFELDLTFQQHPDIDDVAAFAVPSPLGEDDVKIAVILRQGSHLTEEQLFEWALERVPTFALPSYIELVADLPRNPLGKILKYKLTEQGIGEHSWVRPECVR